jgi:hypothetical protein
LRASHRCCPGPSVIVEDLKHGEIGIRRLVAQKIRAARVSRVEIREDLVVVRDALLFIFSGFVCQAGYPSRLEVGPSAYHAVRYN